MLKAFKVEIHPTPKQAQKIVQSIGVCRFLYNRYTANNLELLKLGAKIISADDFDKYVNHELSEELPWIKDCGSKARKKSLVNAETAFSRYFNKVSGAPTFKKRSQQDVKLYFPKNNKGDLKVERHRVKVPTLGWIRTKEKGYIPLNGDVSSCTVEYKASRFYLSILFKAVPLKKKHRRLYDKIPTRGLGMDLGLKEFASVSNGENFANINKTTTIKKVEKSLKRAQRALARKFEEKKKRETKDDEKKYGMNIGKNLLRVQKLFARLSRIREAYRAWVISTVVKTKPQFVTLEKLNVKGMKRNRHLAKAISDQGFYSFKLRLLDACKKFGIELREVGMFYPSSKLCSCCGYKKVHLSLSERIFRCEACGHEMDRDLNAAINLREAREYVVLT